METERSEVDDLALSRENQLRHGGTHRRRRLEARAAESRCDVKSAHPWDLAHHGTMVGAHVVNAHVAVRIIGAAHRDYPMAETASDLGDEVLVVSLAEIVGIRLTLGAPFTEASERQSVALRAKIAARDRVNIGQMRCCNVTFKECNLRAFADDADLHT